MRHERRRPTPFQLILGNPGSFRIDQIQRGAPAQKKRRAPRMSVAHEGQQQQVGDLFHRGRPVQTRGEIHEQHQIGQMPLNVFFAEVPGFEGVDDLPVIHKNYGRDAEALRKQILFFELCVPASLRLSLLLKILDHAAFVLIGAAFVGYFVHATLHDQDPEPSPLLLFIKMGEIIEQHVLRIIDLIASM